MGLDMYLERRVHISNYDFDAGGKILASAVLGALNVKKPEHYANGSISIELPAGYWRKANHIHKWFVDNVQDGEDNCQDSFVTPEHMTELRDLCKQVLADRDRAPELLPTQQGFFFGSDEYDEGYFQDTERTIEILDFALDPDNAVGKNDSFYYRASW